MKTATHISSIRVVLAIAVMASCHVVQAASPSVQQVLRLAPTQAGVDYDRPKPEEIAKCKIVAKKSGNQTGWTVESPTGVVLRKFIDTNRDNVVDLWSYYKNGVEVYRDIDSKFRGKADQFRWLGIAGSRWGVDKNGDGAIDQWKELSAEEATAEVVAALADRDPNRFVSVFVTSEELRTLGLNTSRTDALNAKVAKAEAVFRQLAAQQKTITPESRWVKCGGGKPSIVPAGTDGSTKDLRVYENAVATVQTGDKYTQVQIGTLVQVGDVWKIVDIPSVDGEGQAESSRASTLSRVSATAEAASSTEGMSEEALKQLAELDKFDPLDPRRADVLERLAQHSRTATDRNMWYQQMVDTLSAAVQTGNAPNGVRRLHALFQQLQKDKANRSLAAYVKFRILSADYTQKLQAPNADYTKLQDEFHKNLEQYIADYPTVPDAAEAMLQLGIAQEFAAQEDNAKRWYRRIVAEFADSPAAVKAAGAILRLESVGKTISVSGKSVTGDMVQLADYRGKVVLIHYWATWSNSSKKDFATLRQLVTTYGPKFAIIGVSLDNNAKDLSNYLAENTLPWPQMFEQGGLDSPPANQLGILTVPTMILVDQDGRVVKRAIQASEIAAELERLLR
jgi:TolA-binding protein